MLMNIVGIGIQIGIANLEISVKNTQKTKNKPTIWACYATLEQLLRELDSLLYSSLLSSVPLLPY